MKFHFVTLLILSLLVCKAGDLDVGLVRFERGIGGGIVVSTNAAHAPFGLLSTNIWLPSLIGKKWRDTNLGRSGIRFRSDSVARIEGLVTRPTLPGYSVISGRYAFVQGNTLELVDFEVRIAEGVDQMVLAVESGSRAFQVSERVLKDLERIKKSGSD